MDINNPIINLLNDYLIYYSTYKLLINFVFSIDIMLLIFGIFLNIF